MFRNLFNRSVRRSHDTGKVSALERLMDLPPSAHDIGMLYPIIVPIEFRHKRSRGYAKRNNCGSDIATPTAECMRTMKEQWRTYGRSGARST